MTLLWLVSLAYEGAFCPSTFYGVTIYVVLLGLDFPNKIK